MECGPEQLIPAITPYTMAKRREFAEHHQEKKTDFGKVLAIDSSIFRISPQGGRRRVWRPKGTKVQTLRVKKGIQVHVYGGITAYGKTRLRRVSGTTGLKCNYLKARGAGKCKGVGGDEAVDVLEDTLVPDGDAMFKGVGLKDWQLLMDDAPAHTSRRCKGWLRKKGVSVLTPWPGNSPDLNPIENVWGWMKSRVYKQKCTTLAELQAAVDEAWEAVPDDMLTKLLLGMPQRLEEVTDANGGYIDM